MIMIVGMSEMCLLLWCAVTQSVDRTEVAVDVSLNQQRGGVETALEQTRCLHRQLTNANAADETI